MVIGPNENHREKKNLTAHTEASTWRVRAAIGSVRRVRAVPMQTSSVRAEIDESCETLIWITTGIFLISIFLSILRPEPTLAVCLFGFYGAHTHSKGEPARALRRTPHRRVSLAGL